MITRIYNIYRRWFSPNIEYDDLGSLKKDLALRNYSRMRTLASFLAWLMAVFLVVDIFVINHYKNDRIVDFMILVMADRLLIVAASTFFVLLTRKAGRTDELSPSHYKASLVYMFISFNCLALLSVFLVPLKPGVGLFMMTIMVFTALFRLPGKLSLPLYLPTTGLIVAAILFVQQNSVLIMSDVMAAVFMSISGLATMRILYCSWVRESFNLRLLERQNSELSQKNTLLSGNRQGAWNVYYSDNLTTIPNRIHFMETLRKEWKRAVRGKTQLSIIIADIDQFSALNARCGKKEGDAALEKVAAALSACVMRPGDMVARFGYDEFAVLLPDTGQNGAETVARRLVQSVVMLNFPHPTSDGGIMKIDTGLVSVLPGPDDTPEDAVRRAFHIVCPQKDADSDTVES